MPLSTGRLRLQDLRQGGHYYARAGYGASFHNVVLDGHLLIAKCGRWINVATNPLAIIDHPPYNGAWCKKCDR